MDTINRNGANRMKLMLVDNEPLAVEVFCYESKKLHDLEIVGIFNDADAAYTYAVKNPVDIVALDVMTAERSGMDLGSLLKEKNPKIKLLFITATQDNLQEALDLQADAYLTKPYSAASLEFSLEKVKQCMEEEPEKRIFAKTFGHFDLYVDNKPVMFHSAKAKELLAYLVDREGGTVYSDQIIGTLWEDRPNDEYTQNLCSKVVGTLRKELSAYHAEDLLISHRGVRRIDTTLLDCDLYQLLRGEERASEQYLGEYMMEYSWAESRMASLEKYT